jgi:hypothetical protein
MSHIYKPGFPRTEGRYFVHIAGQIFGLHLIFPVKHINCSSDEDVQNSINHYNKWYNTGVTDESEIHHCEATHQELLSLEKTYVTSVKMELGVLNIQLEKEKL